MHHRYKFTFLGIISNELESHVPTKNTQNDDHVLKGLGIPKLLKQKIYMILENIALIVEFHNTASLPFEANRRLAT